MLYGEGAKSNGPITLLVQGQREDFYTVRFDPALQLLRSVTYNLPSSCKNKSHEIYGTYCLTSKRAIPIQSAIDHFGKPRWFLIQSYSNEGKAAYLIYDGTCFVFEFHNPTRRDLSNLKELSEVKSWLVEVRVAPATNSKLLELESGFSLAKRSVLDFQLPEVHCIVHAPSRRVTGLEIACTCNKEGTENITSSATCVSFGDKSQDVLASLGAPDHLYYSDQHHCQQMGTLANYRNLLKYSDLRSEYSFCYRHLGIDVLFDAQRNQVSKLVLHTNVPNQFEFGFYCRCFYKLSITRDGMSTTSSDDSLLVTPTTNWNVIKSHVESSHARHLKICKYSPSTNTFYPFGKTSLWTLFDQLIVETTASGQIAKITLLAPNRATVLSAKTDKQNSTSTKSTLHPAVKEVETTFQVRIRREEKHTTVDSDEEFQDCPEDLFHSAESSIASTQTETISLKATQSLKEDFTTLAVTEKAYFSHNVNAIIANGCNSSALTQNSDSLSDHSPNRLLYEFLADEEEDGSTSELPSEVATNFSVVHASNTLQISAPTNTSEDGDPFFMAVNPPPSPDGREPPETSSFDFISYSEVIESQRALAEESSSLDSDSEKPQEAMSSVEEPLVEFESKTAAQDNLNPTGKLDSHPELDSQFQTMSESSTACVFHYQPKPTVMTASRIMTLSQDIGLFEKQSHESTKLKKHLITEAAPRPHSTPKALRRDAPPSKSGGGKESGKLIIQRRAGSVASAHKEAKSRLLSHTKSSQQKIKTKYVPKPKKEIEEEEEEEMEEEEGEERKESSGQESESDEMDTVEPSTQQREELLTSVLEPAEHTLEEKEASAGQSTDSMTTAPWKEILDDENNEESETAAMKDQQHSPSPQQQFQESDCETTTTVANHLPSDLEGNHPTLPTTTVANNLPSDMEGTLPNTTVANHILSDTEGTHPNTTVTDDLCSDTETTHPCLDLPPLTHNTEKDSNKEANHSKVKLITTTGTAVGGLPISYQDDKSTAHKVEDPPPHCSPVETKGMSTKMHNHCCIVHSLFRSYLFLHVSTFQMLNCCRKSLPQQSSVQPLQTALFGGAGMKSLSCQVLDLLV